MDETTKVKGLRKVGGGHRAYVTKLIQQIDDNEEGGADEDESAPPEDSNAGEDQTEDIKMPEDETDEKEENCH